jgi:threonyl-tRNA synthetase
MSNLETTRHSCAHLVAAAAQELFPNAKFGVGPTVENGFYYDIDFGQPISEEDMGKIEAKARTMAKEGVKFAKEEMTIDEAIKMFKKSGQIYKVELLNDLKTKGTTKVGDDAEVELTGNEVTIYRTGGFVDLCRGPHLKSSKEIGAFKLTKLAGAYWRGKNENPQLQRVYGVCFEEQKELDEYLAMLVEAEKRDHRKIGAEQELFFIDDMVGKGLVMWQPNGTIIKNEIEKLAIEKEREAGYVRVSTPHMAKEELFLTSGHLPYYKDGMYPPMVMDDGTYYLKAMNCPHHHRIFSHSMHSYRDLPLRVAEYGTLYRNELSGTLAGLLRVRGLTMNDGHIYCRKDQIKQEFKGVLDLTVNYYNLFGLTDYWFRLSKWSPKHLEKYINEPANWEYTEGIIREVLVEAGVKFTEVEDEAAFYGPKIDVQFKSIIGREESLSTIQLDFAAKNRFDLKYTDETGKENSEVFVIHRSPLSTHERFTAFLIEHYAGNWPVWLSPVQVRFIPVSEKHAEGAEAYRKEFFDLNLRPDIDSADETLGNRVRKAVQEKIPYIVVVGDKELEGGDWMVRVRGVEKQEKIPKSAFISRISEEIKNRK